MTDNRCPMCGRPNPEDAEVCQHCEARLKPLVGPPTPEEDFEESGFHESSPEPYDEEPFSEEETDSDWLQSLRPTGDEAQDEADFEAEDDWAGDDQEISLPESPRDQSGADDWLADLRQGGEVESGASEESGEGEDELDWDSPFDQEEAGELPGWLSETEEQDTEEEVPPEVPPGFESSDIDEPEKVEPEWLRRIRDRQRIEESDRTADQGGEPEEQVFQKVPEDDDEAPLDEPQGELPQEISEERPFLDEEGLPEWFSEADETGREGPPPFESDDQEELPDWLTEQGQEPAPEADEEVPDWLPEYEEEETEVEAAEGPPEGEIPDWLSDMEEEEEEPAREAGPAWPSGQTEDDDETRETPITEPEDPEKSGELPDWVMGLEATAPVLEEPQRSSKEEAEQEADLDFDWLEDELGVEPQDGEEVEEYFEEAEEPYGEAPPERSQPFVTGEEPLEELEEGELPEWLSEAASENETIEEEEIIEAAEREEDIEPAELPGWLAAMRPVEAVAPESPQEDESNEVVETSGPLAGLSGVIPAEPEVARRKKTSPYSIKLQVSGNQQAHAGVLQNLVEMEGEPRLIPRGPAIPSQFFLRVGIFVLLVLAVFWPVLSGSQSAPLPVFSKGVFDASNVIGQMSSSAPVLFAVDYNPSLSGEMEAASAAVLDHLMLKGAYLALVSTTPTGPAQAERLVKTINAQGGHHYQGVNEYANLGYIPGGQTGLLSFAQTPRRILPFDLNGNRVWGDTPLQTVQELSDFGLAVVATENPDTARAWIEQVQPQLGQVPLIMVVSAQAEPMVRPYYEGMPQQVQGFVTGLSGGAAYEGLMNRELLGRKYWDAFSLGILAAAGLILVGGGFSLFSALLSGDKNKRGAGQP